MSKRKKMVFVLIVVSFMFISFMSGKADALTTKLRVAVNANMPVYQFLDSEGNPVGIHIDIIEELAQKNNFEIEYMLFDSDADCFKALNNGATDIVLGIKEGQTMDYYFWESDPISSSSLCFISSAEFADEIRTTHSVPYCICAQEYGLTSSLTGSRGFRGLSRCTYYITRSQGESLNLLTSGKVAAAICEYTSAVGALQEMGLEENYEIVYSYLSTVEYTIALRENNYLLRTKLNNGIAELHVSGDYDDILNRWQPVQNGFTLSKQQIRNITVVSLLLVITVVAYFIASSRMQKILKTKVAERTKELSDANQELDNKIAQLAEESSIRYSIIENAFAGIIVIDHAFHILLMNQRAVGMAGLSPNEQYPEDAHSLKIFGDVIRSLGDAIEKDMPSPDLIVLNEDANKRSFRYNSYCLHGEPERILLSVEDVTAEEKAKQAEFEAEKSRTLNTLVAGIAHEIKNPLTAIQAYAMQVREQRGNEEFMEALAETIPVETERVNRLVQSLISYARPPKGIKTAVAVDELLRDCEMLFLPTCRAKGIKVFSTCEPGLVIFVDRNQCKQVLINLCMNGIDSMLERQKNEPKSKEELSLNLSAKAEGSNVEILIQDMGMGMSEESLRMCTEPFYTTKSTGVGLGLSVAEQVIRENGGQLHIESVLGEGSCFSLSFRRYEG